MYYIILYIKEFQPTGKGLGPVDGIHWSQARALGEALWRYPDFGSAFGSIRVQVFGHASLWACGFSHRSGLVLPGRVQSIGVGPGRRGLVGAAQLDAQMPRVRVYVWAQPKLPYKKNVID